MPKPLKLHNKDRKVLAEHFAGRVFNDKIVFEFCKRNKIAVTDAGSVEDFIYQANYDKRMKKVIPLILAEISTYKVSGEYDKDEVKKSILNFNNDISERIARVIENNDVLFREMDLLKALAGDISQLLQNAEGLSSRMCANVLAEMAQEKLGDPLTIKSLANERAQIADRKAKKIDKTT